MAREKATLTEIKALVATKKNMMACMLKRLTRSSVLVRKVTVNPQVSMLVLPTLSPESKHLTTEQRIVKETDFEGQAALGLCDKRSDSEETGGASVRAGRDSYMQPCPGTVGIATFGFDYVTLLSNSGEVCLVKLNFDHM